VTKVLCLVENNTASNCIAESYWMDKLHKSEVTWKPRGRHTVLYSSGRQNLRKRKC